MPFPFIITLLTSSTGDSYHQYISREVSTGRGRDTRPAVCESIFGTQLSSLSRDTAGQMRADRYFQHGRLQCDLVRVYNAEYSDEHVANRLDGAVCFARGKKCTNGWELSQSLFLRTRNSHAHNATYRDRHGARYQFSFNNHTFKNK